MVSETNTRRLWSGGSEKGGSFNLSFAGCGFLGIYHVGVGSCIKEYAPHLIADQIGGASAGALVAAALLTNACLGDATTYTLRIAGKARQRALGPLHPSFNIVKHMREGLDTYLPDNAHKIANGRLNVSLTRVSDRENVVVNQFDSKEELIQVLMCSSFIPFYCGILPPKYRGVRYVDGGLSDNIPILNDHTITVSPFAGESDICPTDISANDMHINLVNTSIQCTTGNLYRASYAFFPPHPEVLADTCKQGFNDTLRFLQQNTLINTTRHLTMKSAMVTEEADPSHPVNLVDSDSEESDDSDCDDCIQYRNDEPLSSLPPSVIIALETAIDSVNKGLLAPMYNSRAFSVVSLMAAPAILPVDVAVVLAQRLYEWVPYMPSDMQWFVYEIGTVLQELLYFVKHGRHQYSARVSLAGFLPSGNGIPQRSGRRFSCQLAITEMDVVPPTAEGHIAGTPAASPFIQRCTTMTATERTHHHHQRQHHKSAPSSRHVLPSTRAHRAASGYNGPVHCAEDLRHELLEDSSHSHFKLKRPRIEDSANYYGGLDSDDDDDEWFVNDMAETAESTETQHLQDEVSDETYGKFENVLEVADNTDSILAFYYTEEDNPGVVQVTEIFPLDDPTLDVQLGQMRSRSSSIACVPIRKKNGDAQSRPGNDNSNDSDFHSQTASNGSRRLRTKSDSQKKLSESDSHIDFPSGGNRSRKFSLGGSRGPIKRGDSTENVLSMALSESNLYASSGEARSRKSSALGRPMRRQSDASQIRRKYSIQF